MGYLDRPFTKSQKHYLALETTLLLLATFAVILRFSSRYISKAKLWWDDFFIVAGLAFCYLVFATAVIGIQDGFEISHAYAKITAFTKGRLIQVLFYTCGTYTVKASVLLMYYRIFSIKRHFRYMVCITGFVVGVCFLASFFAILFECTPISYFWSYANQGYCINRLALYISTAVINSCLDIVILCLPAAEILQLQLRKAQRIQLLISYLFGTFVCVVSIIRMVAIIIQPRSDDNPTVQLRGDDYWTTIEAYVAVIGACLPTLHPILLKSKVTFDILTKSLRTSSQPSSGHQLGLGSPRDSTYPGSERELISSHDSKAGLGPTVSRWCEINSNTPRNETTVHENEIPLQAIQVHTELRSSSSPTS